MQGIDWAPLSVNRSRFREMRKSSYVNYKSLASVSLHNPLKILNRGNYYQFLYTNMHTKCEIAHFQLRNLVWATSKNDIYYAGMSDSIEYAGESAIKHWNPLTKKTKEIISPQSCALSRISTLCAKEGALIAGGTFFLKLISRIFGRFCISTIRSDWSSFSRNTHD